VRSPPARLCCHGVVDELETRLAGGHLTEVWRLGDTVRRPAGPWTPTVHALLRHLEAVGFAGAPRALGVDQRGREVLGYLEGQVPAYPVPARLWSEAVLVEAAWLLRRLHDATAGFRPPAAVWRRGAAAPGGGDVICHNDVAHYNTVFVAGRPMAFIDWDFAAPGPRAWDLAYAAYRFVPLVRDGYAPLFGVPLPVDRPARLRRFCDAYGLSDRAGLVDVLVRRIEAVCDLIVDQAAEGDPAFVRMRAEGHVDSYRRDVEFIWSTRASLERALDEPG
jgi:aminoglycoside phosphotransferase (APT) family kinase protein